MRRWLRRPKPLVPLGQVVAVGLVDLASRSVDALALEFESSGQLVAAHHATRVPSQLGQAIEGGEADAPIGVEVCGHGLQ